MSAADVPQKPLLTPRETDLSTWIAARFDKLVESGQTTELRLLNAVIAQVGGALTLDKEGLPQQVTEVEEKFTQRLSRAAKTQEYSRAEFAVALLAFALARAKIAAGEV